MQSAVKAVIFDIGGTLRVSRQGEPRDLIKVEQMMSLLGETISAEAFIEKIRVGSKQYRKWCKPNYIELNEEELLTRFLLADYDEKFVRANAITLNQLWRDSRHKYVLPDMAATMRSLAARGYKLGLISNTTSSVEGHWLLKELGITELFSAVVLSAAFGRRKPHPSIFLEAARQAGVHPSECAYVGDRPSRDLIGALQSGYSKTVIIRTEGYELDKFDKDDLEPDKDTEIILEPDHRIGKLTQLLEIFPQITAKAPNTLPTRSEVVYDVALSTMWGVDQKIPFEETFAIAQSIGIHRFELNHRVTDSVFNQFKYDHHYVSTVHDPCRAAMTFDEQKSHDYLISSLDEEKRKIGVEFTCRSIDLACQLGSRSLVIHPGSMICDRSKDNKLRKLYENGQKGTAEFEQLKAEIIAHRSSLVDGYLSQVLKSLLEIAEYNIRCKGPELALENRYRIYDLPLTDELDLMLAVGDGTAFGFQYDFGHAVALDELGLVNQAEWLERFGDRIVGVHIDDIDGITDHLVPGLGRIDFSKISPYLPENCQKTLEIGPQANIEQISAGLEVLFNAGIISKL